MARKFKIKSSLCVGQVSDSSHFLHIGGLQGLAKKSWQNLTAQASHNEEKIFMKEH